MIRAAEASGELKPGMQLIEPTSGNTGLGLAMAAAVLGYQLTLVMPDTMSIERRKLAAAYGARILLTPGAQGMSGAVEAAERLAREQNGYIPSQFTNPANARAHYETTRARDTARHGRRAGRGVHQCGGHRRHADRHRAGAARGRRVYAHSGGGAGRIAAAVRAARRGRTAYRE